MSIVKASNQVIEEIRKMLDENGSNERQLRIVGSLGFGEIPEGFKIMPGEVTPKDHVEELNGITFIVANILVKLYKSFDITCKESNGITDLKITAENRQPSTCLA
jgi:Fe-S cluster assembly iron-binding protein IscA